MAKVPAKSSPATNKYVAPTGGIFHVIPSKLVPYAELMRLDRPHGFYAFYWHYGIGLGLAACLSNTPPSPEMLIQLAVYLVFWVVILRGAVCAINDNFDQEFDRQVARTRFRPIARRAVSTAQANIFTVILIILGAFLTLPFPTSSWQYATCTYVILSVYPLGKRVTDFPQVVLGFGFAVPIFMCCAILGIDLFDTTAWAGGQYKLDVKSQAAIATYFASVLWTVIFDTVYAHQDLQYDIKAGVKSLAVRLGDNTKTVLGFMAYCQISLQIYVGVICGFGPAYFIFNVLGSGMVLATMLISVDLKVPAECAWWFGPGSKLVGANLVGGFIGEYLIKRYR